MALGRSGEKNEHNVYTNQEGVNASQKEGQLSSKEVILYIVYNHYKVQ